MLDINFIRDNRDKVIAAAKNKTYEVDIPKLLDLDEKRRSLIQESEALRQERNQLSDAMKGTKPTPEQLETGKKLKETLAEKEQALDAVMAEFSPLLKRVPNMPLDEVPLGTSEDDNVVIREWGQRPEFGFEPKNHAEIAKAKGWLDSERATKIAASRFVYLKGDLVMLEFALWQFALSRLTNEEFIKQIIAENNLKVSSKPFTPVLPPAVAKTEAFVATGRLNKEEQTYKLEDEDLWLNASAEHTISPMYMNEILDEDLFPIRYVGYTTAFRREAGTYGKDMEGILRLHQFNKLEMECFNLPEDSLQEHLLLVAIQEKLMQLLGLPHQVLEKCTADIGFPNAKGIDINVWLPGQNKYRETHTADYITDFQAEGMKTRVRRRDGTVELVHTNDATAFSQRPLIGIIENYQTADGDVRVPEVLIPYMGKEVI